MKKTFKSILFATLSVFAFTCCEDVPAPYQIPGTEEKVPDKEIAPTGDGTLENPFNVAGVLDYISKLQADTESPQEVYVKGIVLQNSTDEATITGHGNMSFTMIDEGNKSKTFLAWQVYGPGKKKFTSVNQIKMGDKVVVCGKVINYKGNTPETVNKGQAYVYSINGESEGGDTPPSTSTKETPLSVAQAKTAGGNNYVKGYIVGYVDGAKLDTGSQFSVPSSAETEVIIADSPEETDPANVLPVQLPVGAVRDAVELSKNPGNLKKEVLLYGSLETYFGTIGMKSTSWGKIGDTAFGEDPEGGDTPPVGTEITCAKAVELTNELENGATSTETYTIIGYITEVVGNVDKNQQSFWMADTKDGGQVYYSFWANLPEGVTAFVQGTKVKITGKLIKFFKNNTVTPEMKNATVEIIEEGDGGDGGDGGEGGDTSEYGISLTYEKGTNFYDTGVATINGVAECKVLKIGTSKNPGDFTVTVPAGKHSFYAITWKDGNPADVVLKNGEDVIETVTVQPNDGATGNSPYTITVTEADKYEFEVSEACTITITSDKRVLFFGIK